MIPPKYPNPVPENKKKGKEKIGVVVAVNDKKKSEARCDMQ